MTSKGVLPEKDLLEKAAAIESFEYFMLGKKSKTKPLLQKKQYQKTGSTFASNKNEEDNLKWIEFKRNEFIKTSLVFKTK